PAPPIGHSVAPLWARSLVCANPASKGACHVPTCRRTVSIFRPPFRSGRGSAASTPRFDGEASTVLTASAACRVRWHAGCSSSAGRRNRNEAHGDGGCPYPRRRVGGIALSRFRYRRRKTLAPQGPRKLSKLDVAGSTPVARSWGNPW